MTPKRIPSIEELPPCVEHGLWTPIPVPPPKKKLRLRLRDVAKDEAKAVAKREVMSLHAAGCSGSHDNHAPQYAVSRAMIAQVAGPASLGGDKRAPAPSFFLHLGDIIYKGDIAEDSKRNHQPTLYDEQLYTPYAKYDRSIFALAGNHDGKHHEVPEKSAIDHFLGNFCDPLRKKAADAEGHRPPMTQPYPYFVLDTPVAVIVCLYCNVINAGQLDDPMGKDTPQYDWLVKALTRIRKKKSGKAVLLALHYPPYSGARDFVQRGDPAIGPTPRRVPMQPLAAILQKAFRESGQVPDAIISAHAHNYQRITYRYKQGRELPCLIVGTGGHSLPEPLAHTPAGKHVPLPRLPYDTVLPPGFRLPKGDSAKLVSYQDEQPGFLRLTINQKTRRLTGEYFRVPCFGKKVKDAPSLFDAFTLDLKKHRILKKGKA
jgi:hypothetical protein